MRRSFSKIKTDSILIGILHLIGLATTVDASPFAARPFLPEEWQLFKILDKEIWILPIWIKSWFMHYTCIQDHSKPAYQISLILVILANHALFLITSITLDRRNE